MIEYEDLKLANGPFESELIQKAIEVIKSGHYILGEQVNKFEDEFANYLGVNSVIGVGNGTEAIALAFEALALPERSEVIMPANAYIASIFSVIRVGLKPVLVDPDINTCLLSPDSIEQHITKKTKAILPVHLYGLPCEIDRIMQIASDNNLYVVEDCAQAHGAMVNNKYVGNFGNCGAFSFYPTKNLGGLGDGGAITCNDEEMTSKIKKIINYGSLNRYSNDIIGTNSRLDEIQAAFLIVKLKYLEKINEHKGKLAKIYNSNLNEYFIKPLSVNYGHRIYHIYNVRHPRRDDLKQFLESKKIKTDIHYPLPPYKQKALQGIIKGEFPVSDGIHNTTLSLPLSYMHTEDDIYRVCEIMNSFR